MAEQRFLFVEDIMEILQIKRSCAYGIIKSLNKELSDKGYYTQRGRVPKRYFDDRFGIEVGE